MLIVLVLKLIFGLISEDLALIYRRVPGVSVVVLGVILMM